MMQGGLGVENLGVSGEAAILHGRGWGMGYLDMASPATCPACQGKLPAVGSAAETLVCPRCGASVLGSTGVETIVVKSGPLPLSLVGKVSAARPDPLPGKHLGRF